MLTKESVLDRLIKMLEHPESITKADLRKLENEVSIADIIAPRRCNNYAYT